MKLHTYQKGLTLSGLIMGCALIAVVAIVGMKLFPLYNQKFQVDLALENVGSDRSAAQQSKRQLVKAIMRQFEVTDVDAFSTRELGRTLKVGKKRGVKGKVMSLTYEIRGPFFGELDIVLKYHKEMVLGQPSD